MSDAAFNELLDLWSETMRKRDQLLTLRDGLRDISGVQLSTLENVESLLKETEAKLQTIQAQLRAAKHSPR